jgi:UDP-N-acetylmuramoyl-L-alanyl-D-glutamate--2,6-diaminopimelate ligase
MTAHSWQEIFPEFAAAFPPGTPVGPLVADDRQLKKDGLQNGPLPVFFAIRGTRMDGHDFISRAVANGARVIFGERDFFHPLEDSVTFLRTEDCRKLWAEAQRRWNGKPDEKLHLHGVTGTCGKTSTVFFLQQLLGPGCGRMSSVDVQFAGTSLPSSHTTPDAAEAYEILGRGLAGGCDHFALEMSSHALDQKRLWGIHLATAIFTNLSREHLDFHGSLEKYGDAKLALFDGRNGPLPERMILGCTDCHGRLLNQILREKNNVPITVGRDSGCQWQLVEWIPEETGARIRWRMGKNFQDWRVPLIGEFNGINLLLALAAAHFYRPLEDLFPKMATLTPPQGRMEPFPLANGACAFVDYAHKPRALAVALEALHLHFPGKKIAVIFGCGGNRDRGKRPQMARIAERLADFIVLTNDNPRDEDPEAIIREICAGFSTACHRKSLSREEAIHMGVEYVQGNGGILLVAGKGHETYQEMGGRRFPFDDGKILRQCGGSNGRYYGK